MRKLLLLLIIGVFMVSCNPRLYIVSSGMRHHNLSQNKYQPNKHRKQVKVGRRTYSPIYFYLRRN